jgi:N-acetylmuramoyl-L-alanine amidase
MIKICIDPGHGGTDRANMGPTGYVEADGVLTVSKYLQTELLSTGAFYVMLTRSMDATLSLTERAKAAIDFGAQLFISEHTNAGGGSGTEVFYSVDLPGDKSLAADMSKAISSALGIPDRGAKVRESTKYPGEDYYTVIDVAQDGGVPHVLLVESAYHDRAAEEKLLKDDASLLKIAQAQAAVIYGIFGVTYPSDNELRQAVERISANIPSGLDIDLWSGTDNERKVKYIDLLLIKIAESWK